MILEILKAIDGLSFIASLVCISVICHLSRTDPFETHTIQNITNYFNQLPNNSNFSNLTDTETESDSKEFEIQSKVEQIKTENKEIDKNNTIEIEIINKNFLRKLESSSCEKFENSLIKNEGSKFSSVFDVKFNKIHKLSIGLIVVICFSKVGILIPFFLCGLCKYNLITKVRCLFFLLLNSILTNIVLLIIIAVTYNKSDIGDFNDFLNCPNIKENSFEMFSKVTKLRNYFIAFEVTDSIVDAIDSFLEAYEAYKGFEEKAKQIESNPLHTLY